MEPPYNGVNIAQTRHHIPPSKTFSARNELHLVELMAKGTHVNLKIFLAFAMATICSPQTDTTLFLNTAFPYLIELGEVEMGLTRGFSPTSCFS